jgi:hypothetical protein
VEELQDHRRADGADAVSVRLHASPPEFAHRRGSAAAALPAFAALGGDGDAPVAVTLTPHDFAWPHGEGDGPAQRQLRLTMLVLPRCRPADWLLPAVFGPDTHVALRTPGEQHTATDVALGNVRRVAAERARCVARAEPASLRAALRAQRLAAAAACVALRWTGGFAALRADAAAVQPTLAPLLSALATCLAAAPSAAPTRRMIWARERQAPALVAYQGGLGALANGPFPRASSWAGARTRRRRPSCRRRAAPCAASPCSSDAPLATAPRTVVPCARRLTGKRTSRTARRLPARPRPWREA